MNINVCIVVNFLLQSQGLLHIFLRPPIPPTSDLSSNTQTEDIGHAGRMDSSVGRVLALHARGPGFESRCSKQ